METKDFIEMIEIEKQSLEDCIKEAKKSQKTKDWDSREWHREQGEIAGFRTAIITFNRVLFKLNDLQKND